MKDYKLSELKEICNNTSDCNLCPIIELCAALDNGGYFGELDINGVKNEETT